MLIWTDADVAFEDGVVQRSDGGGHVSKCVPYDGNSSGFETVNE
jgi:hypothetical protein